MNFIQYLKNKVSALPRCLEEVTYQNFEFQIYWLLKLSIAGRTRIAI